MGKNLRIESNSIHRRDFLQNSALIVGGMLLGPTASCINNDLPDETIKVGIIGCGNRGAGLASLLKDIKEIQLIACCDIISEHLQNAMSFAAPGAKSYIDYRQLLDDKNVNAVIIATPLFLHYPMAIDAIQAGKHVFLEKSMTYDIPQAINMVKKVKESGLIFQVGFQYRHYSLYHKVKEIIAQNWLGKVTHLQCQYNRNSNWRVPVNDPKMERVLNWRMYREYCGGPLSELCAHQIDAVNFLLDSHPLKVAGMGGINYWKDGRDTFDNIRTIYEYPNGIKATFTSVLSNAYNGYSIHVLGDKATLEIQRDKAFLYSESLENVKGVVDGVTGATITNATQGKAVELMFKKSPTDDLEPTILALTNFAECIRSKKQPASNVETGRDASIAIHLGNLSADTETFQTWKPEYSL